MEFGNVGVNKKRLLGEVSRLDENEGLHGLTLEEKHKREELKDEIDHLISLEEIAWRKKSRAIWLKKRDNNTKYFHKMANSHRRYNHLGCW